MRQLLIVLLVLLFTSCKVVNKDVFGSYKMKNFPKTTLTLKPNYTFDFIQNFQNPYLLPFEHSDQKYFRTSGNWELKEKELILNSTKDSLFSPLYNISSTDTSTNKTTYLQTEPSFLLITRNSNPDEFCSYVFFDTEKDTIPILFVKTPKGDVSRLHGSMMNFSWDKNIKDTLQFFFFGYNPITIVNSLNGETNNTVYLQPEYKPNWFIETKFKASKNKIIHLNSRKVFRK